MTSPEVRSVSNNQQYDGYKTGTASDKVGTKLAEGQVGKTNTIVEKDVEAEKEKQKRENAFKQSLKQYKIEEKDALNFINKIYGYSKEDILNSKIIDSKKFAEVIRLFEAVVEFMVKNNKGHKNNTDTQAALDRAADRVNSMLKDGNTIEQTINFIENFEDNGFFDVLKMKFPNKLGKYNSLKEVKEKDPNVLKECMASLFKQNKTNKNSQSDFGKMSTVFKHLLSNTKTEDIKILWETFCEAVTPEEIMGITKAAIDKIPNKMEFIAHIKNMDKNILDAFGIDDNAIKIFEAYATGKLTNEEDITKTMKEVIEIIGIIVKNADLLKVIKKLNENKFDISKLNEEELKIYNDNKQLFDKITAGYTGIIAAGHEKEANEILKKAEEAGISDYLMHDVATFIAQNPDIFDNISNQELIDIINKNTDNAYAEVFEIAKASGSASGTNKESSDNTGFGFAQSKTLDDVSLAKEYLYQANIADDESKNSFVIINPKQNGGNKEECQVVTAGSGEKFILKEKTAGEIISGIREHKTNVDNVLKECTANLSTSVGQATLMIFSKIPNSIQKIQEYLNKLDSSIAAGKIIQIFFPDRYQELKENNFEVCSCVDTVLENQNKNLIKN